MLNTKEKFSNFLDIKNSIRSNLSFNRSSIKFYIESNNSSLINSLATSIIKEEILLDFNKRFKDIAKDISRQFNNEIKDLNINIPSLSPNMVESFCDILIDENFDCENISSDSNSFVSFFRDIVNTINIPIVSKIIDGILSLFDNKSSKLEEEAKRESKLNRITEDTINKIVTSNKLNEIISKLYNDRFEQISNQCSIEFEKKLKDIKNQLEKISKNKESFQINLKFFENEKNNILTLKEKLKRIKNA